ncbi:hypothetical protein [Micropruina sp.]|uniref:hypothetical protein n=1 Tax=Micropruina sp. TaxID=2737536 RepID=UPI0039E3321F
MTDPNRPQDPGQPNNPQVPSAGSPYAAPGSYPAPGQQPYGQPGFGEQPIQGSPGYGPQAGFGQQPAGQPGYGQPGYGQPTTPIQAPGAGAGAPPPSGWGQAPVPPGQPAAKSGNKMPLLIGGAVILVIALIVGLMQMFNRQGTSAGTTPSDGATASQGSGVGAGTAMEVVQKYFDGLAASDPEAIFALTRGDLPDRTFLTKEVMTAASQSAPITDVQLTETKASTYSSEVSASYTISGRSQTQKFHVSSRDNAWYLTTITESLYVKSLSPADIGLTVNGVAVPDVDSIDVFPGGYTLGTTSKVFALSDDKIVVESLSSSSDIYDIKVGLSDASLKDFKAATTELVNSCKKPGSLTRDDCGIRFRQPTGDKAKISTIACKASGTNSINRLKPTLDTSDMTVSASLSISWTCTMSGSKGKYRGYASLVRVYGTLSDDGTWTVSGEKP